MDKWCWSRSVKWNISCTILASGNILNTPSFLTSAQTYELFSQHNSKRTSCMEVIATQTNWSKFCLVQGLRKLKQIGPLRRQNRSRAQENGKCSCADEWCYACPVKSADSDADTMMDELSHMSDLVKLPFLSHQASCIWHFTTKHRRRCTNGVHIQKYILKGISIFYLDQKCSLSKPYLKSGSKTEFCGNKL